jgi:hypothetical protein
MMVPQRRTDGAPPNVRGVRDGVGLRSCTLLAYVNGRPRVKVLLSSRYRATRRGCALTESGADVVACAIRPCHGTTVGGGVHTLTVGGCLSDGWPGRAPGRCPFRRRGGGHPPWASGFRRLAVEDHRAGGAVGSAFQWAARPCHSVAKMRLRAGCTQWPERRTIRTTVLTPPYGPGDTWSRELCRSF